MLNNKIKLKSKKLLYIALGTSLILVLGAIFTFVLTREKVYFYKMGTDIPVANEPIQINFFQDCVHSNCRSVNYTLYEGFTNEEGAITLSKWRAKKVNMHAAGFEYQFKSNIQSENFTRMGDYYTILPNAERDSNEVYLIETMDPNQSMTVDLGQEFYPREDQYPPLTLRTFQLSKIDQGEQEIELTYIITHYPDEKATRTITLRKGEPGYIPGQMTDSTITLEDLTENQATLRFDWVDTIEAFRNRSFEFY